MVFIGVKIISIELYYYFGFDIECWLFFNNFGEGCLLNNVFLLVFKFVLDDKKMLDFKLKFDLGFNLEYFELEDSVYYVKIFWSVNVVCVKDYNRSVIVNFWDVFGRSVFCYS